MESSDVFDKLTGEVIQSGAMRVGDERVKLRSETDEVTGLTAELTKKLEASKELSKTRFPAGPAQPLQWSLLSNTAYSVTHKAAKRGDGLNTLCCTVVDEVDPYVLEKREDLLLMTNAMELRLSLWLHVNQWLAWDSSGVQGTRRFDYWDRIPDKVPVGSSLYTGEKAEKIRRLLMSHLNRLRDLGNTLTRSAALANNPDSDRKDAVISLEMKACIDVTLEVGTSNSRRTGMLTQDFRQGARSNMDRQRLLICPPTVTTTPTSSPEEIRAEKLALAHNPFARMAPYRYSQVTFKNFTDDEVRRQAGKEALPTAKDLADMAKLTPTPATIASLWGPKPTEPEDPSSGPGKGHGKDRGQGRSRKEPGRTQGRSSPVGSAGPKEPASPAKSKSEHSSPSELEYASPEETEPEHTADRAKGKPKPAPGRFEWPAKSAVLGNARRPLLRIKVEEPPVGRGAGQGQGEGESGQRRRSRSGQSREQPDAPGTRAGEDADGESGLIDDGRERQASQQLGGRSAEDSGPAPEGSDEEPAPFVPGGPLRLASTEYGSSDFLSVSLPVSTSHPTHLTDRQQDGAAAEAPRWNAKFEARTPDMNSDHPPEPELSPRALARADEIFLREQGKILEGRRPVAGTCPKYVDEYG